MSRFGSRSRKDLTEFQTDYPLSAFVFDVLHLDGEDLIDRPAVERFAALDERLPEELRPGSSRRTSRRATASWMTRSRVGTRA